MKYVFVIIFAAILSAVVGRPDEKYTEKFDNIDIDEILQNKRLLNGYFNCIITGKGCSPDGQELRGNLPDVYETGCSKCNERQLYFLQKVLVHIKENEPEMYEKIDNMYDPEGIYKKQHKARLDALGIKL